MKYYILFHLDFFPFHSINHAQVILTKPINITLYNREFGPDVFIDLQNALTP